MSLGHQTDDPPRADPCPHMRNWVSAMADGSLKGLAAWYTRLHVGGCPRCKAALSALIALRDRLRSLVAPAPTGTGEEVQAGMPPERWTAMEAEFERLEEQAKQEKEERSPAGP